MSKLRFILFVLSAAFFLKLVMGADFESMREMKAQHDPDSWLIWIMYLAEYVGFPLIALWGAYAISGTIASWLGAGTVPTSYTQRVEGIIESIDFSGMRVNGVPLPDAKVRYDGILGHFSPLPKEFREHFEVGDTVMIAHHPDDKTRAEVDVELSIQKKSGIEAS
jgi:hypothetical protein